MRQKGKWNDNVTATATAVLLLSSSRLFWDVKWEWEWDQNAMYYIQKVHTKYTCATISFYYYYYIIYKIGVRFVCYIRFSLLAATWKLLLFSLLLLLPFAFFLFHFRLLSLSLFWFGMWFRACHRVLVCFINSEVYIQQTIDVEEQVTGASQF